MIDLAELAGLLPDHLAGQRWYGGPAGPVTVVDHKVLRDGSPGLVGVTLVVGDEPAPRWQLLLGRRADWDIDNVGKTAAVGHLADGIFWYDALVDPALAMALLEVVAPGLEVPVEGSEVRPITAEQSNTSLVFHERFILKVLRRLAGDSPDVVVTRALTDAGYPHVAGVVGVWRDGVDDRAILQRYLAGGVEGWALALTSLRDLLGADCDPGEAGGDFAPEAARLGVLTAELHIALAAALGTVEADVNGWASVLSDRVRRVRHPDLQGGLEFAALARVDALRTVPDMGRTATVHGDYHLGQVLQTDEGWFVVDFEGEPGAVGPDRTARSSPLRDVAAMLRSLHYAARVAAGGDAVAIEQAEQWEGRNRQAFLKAYRQEMAGRDLVPQDDGSFEVVLTAFEVDKAVYEIGYEQAHRPDWVEVPLAGLRRLLAQP